MNVRVNSVLRQVRRFLEQEDDVTAYGPGVAADIGGEDAATAAPGEGGADNPATVGDALDAYLTNIADLLGLEFDLEDEEALNFVFDAADDLSGEGKLPEVPGDDSSDEEIALWLGNAKTVGFSAHVLSKAREMAAKEK